MADEYAMLSQQKTAKAYSGGKISKMIVPMTVYTPEGWVVADRDQQPRPDTTMEGLKELKTPFRPMGKVTPGNASGLNDGACGVLLMSADKARELKLQPKMRLVAYTYAGVRPEVMGLGPIPATHRVLEIAGLTIDRMDYIELNEAFAVQCIAFMQEFKLKWPDDPRLNPWGGAIAFGHPLASSGPRLMIHLMHEFVENPKAKYGLATMCVGLGQGGSVIWENLQREGETAPKKKTSAKGKKK